MLERRCNDPKRASVSIRRSVLTLQAILRHDSGIATRHSRCRTLNAIFS